MRAVPAEVTPRAPGGNARPVVAVHAGAGDHADELREHEAECRAALAEALHAARSALERGLDAMHAVQAAVMVMEDFELFNAGVGSALCSDGSVEMSAALMRGSDRAAGAVAGVRHTANPILGARAVLDSPQVMLVGEAADQRAAAAGVRQQAPEHFITARQQAGLQHASHGDRATVGAVCLDRHGQLAAATSTGGIRGQPPGRVGDCPIIGAGTWADEHAAVSCTGDGEAFIRCTTARQVAALTRSGTPVVSAGEEALRAVSGLQASGGLIAVDHAGNAATPFTTPIMPRGLWRGGSEPSIWLI